MNSMEDAVAFWRRALDTFEDAGTVRHNHSIANRAYYAAFYAVSALFALDAISFKKHTQVETAVHRDLVRRGKWPAELGGDYSWLLRYRTTGDYRITYHVTDQDASTAIAYAERILRAVHEAHPEVFPL